MKKIILLLFVFFTSMILVSCDKKTTYPKVDSKDEVELTSEEFLSMVSEFDVENGKTIEVKILQEIKSDTITLNSEITGKINKAGAKLSVTVKGDYKISEETSSIEIEYDMYMTNSKMYMNLKTIKTGEDSASVEIKPGKYLLDGNDIFAGLTDLDLEILGDIESTTLIDIESLYSLETFKGLKVYKNKDKTTIMLTINEETGMPEINQSAINVDYSSITSGEVFIVFENNKLVNLSGRMNMEFFGMSSYSEYIYQLSNDEIKFPDFNSYQPFVS